jgi:hypothetical protein
MKIINFKNATLAASIFILIVVISDFGHPVSEGDFVLRNLRESLSESGDTIVHGDLYLIGNRSMSGRFPYFTKRLSLVSDNVIVFKNGKLVFSRL